MEQLAAILNISGNSYNQHSKINKNQVLEQSYLQNDRTLKTGSIQTHSKSKRKLLWVFYLKKNESAWV